MNIFYFSKDPVECAKQHCDKHCIKMIVENNPCIHFMYMGTGKTMQRVKKIIEDNGTAGNITFAGVIPHAEVPDYLAACDILVSPQIPNPDGTPFFGSPTKLFEYMACQRPIIATDLLGITEVLIHYGAGFTYPGEDADGLAMQLLDLYNRPPSKSVFDLGGHEYIRQYHSWDAVAEKIEGVITNLL